MNNVKKIAVLVLVIAAMTGFTQAATRESRPDATLRMSIGGVHLGIGGSSGSGTLTYRGRNYPFRVSGMAVGRVGVTSSSAVGDVFNLRHLRDFNGNYTVGGAGTRGVTLGWENWHHHVKSGRRDNPHFLDTTGRCCQRDWRWPHHATPVMTGLHKQ